MPSGGARARSGPPPDPTALRRDRKTDGEWTILPAEGRGGADAPTWPLTRISSRETQLWRKLWAKPQAVQWERMGQEFEVALYVRRLAEAEKSDSSTAASTLVRQMADALGLSIPGLRVNRWKIAVDQVANQREQRQAPATSKTSARDRFRVVNGEQAG